MGRLTIRTEEGAALKLDNPQSEAEARRQLHDKYIIAIEKLAAYEDLEEQGYSRQKLQPQPTVSDVIEEAKNNFCRYYCKYTEECEERMEADEDLRPCPLDRL